MIAIRGRTPLQHAFPAWIDDPHGDGEARQMFHGKMRIVHSARRMHKLRRRGVPLMHLGVGDGKQRLHHQTGGLRKLGPWAWFETEESYEGRKLARRMLQQMRMLGEAHAIRYNNEGWDILRQAVFAALAKSPALLLKHELDVQTATGYQLDALFGVRTLPITENLTDAEVRTLALLKQQSDAGLHYDWCDCPACMP